MSAFGLIISIDPGQSGAIAFLADGQFDGVQDMPTKPRQAGGNMVDEFKLAHLIRQGNARHPMASTLAVIERVQGIPNMGSHQTFRFGEAYGIVRGVLGGMGIRFTTVRPQEWKKHHGLIGTEKDESRIMMLSKLPAAADYLKRKKDDGRADALAIGLWAHETELSI